MGEFRVLPHTREAAEAFAVYEPNMAEYHAIVRALATEPDESAELARHDGSANEVGDPEVAIFLRERLPTPGDRLPNEEHRHR